MFFNIKQVEQSGNSEPDDVIIEPISESSDEDVFEEEMSTVHIDAGTLMSRMKIDCEVCVAFHEANPSFIKNLVEDVSVFGNHFFCQRVKKIGRGHFLKTYKEATCITNIMNCFKNYPSKNNLSHFMEENTHFNNFLEPAAKLYTEKRIREELKFFNSRISERSKLHRLTHFKGF